MPSRDPFFDDEERATLHADVMLVAAEARAVRRALSEVANFSMRRRRRDVTAFIFAVILAIHAHEIGRNVCGASAWRMNDGISPQAVAVCDVVWPESSTSPMNAWPTEWNLVGFALYGLALVGLAVWWRRTPNILLPPPRTRAELIDELEE